MTNMSDPKKEKRISLKLVKNATFKFMRIFSGSKSTLKNPSLQIPVIDDQNSFGENKDSLYDDLNRSDSITIFDPSPRRKYCPTYDKFTGKILVITGDFSQKHRLSELLKKNNFTQISLPNKIRKAAQYLFKISENEYRKKNENENEYENCSETLSKKNYELCEKLNIDDLNDILKNNSELISKNYVHHVNEFIVNVKSHGSQNLVITDLNNFYEHYFLKNIFPSNYKIVHLKAEDYTLTSSLNHLDNFTSYSTKSYNPRQSLSSENSIDQKRIFSKTATFNSNCDRDLNDPHLLNDNLNNLKNINFDLNLKVNNDSFQSTQKNDEEIVKQFLNLWIL